MKIESFHSGALFRNRRNIQEFHIRETTSVWKGSVSQSFGRELSNRRVCVSSSNFILMLAADSPNSKTCSYAQQTNFLSKASDSLASSSLTGALLPLSSIEYRPRSPRLCGERFRVQHTVRSTLSRLSVVLLPILHLLVPRFVVVTHQRLEP